MKYCKKCILPDTRPNLVIGGDGVCNACKSWSDKGASIDWVAREKQLHTLVAEVKSKRVAWDCVIPVSGGKDSTWQTLKALELGLKPLCVTWRSPARTELGQQNLDNLISLGVDHIDFSISPEVEKEFTLKTFIKCGSPAIPMHFALFSIPLQIAVKFNIPLVLWGENSASEYGTTDSSLDGFNLNEAWLEKYGVTQGTRITDWIDESLTPKKLAAYTWPKDKQMKNSGVKAAFLGWFLKWDPEMAYNEASQNGFKKLSGKPKTGYYSYADVDDAFLISIHHWMKWYKFGFTRTWDNLSLEIRAGRMSREEAWTIAQARGEERPEEDINQFCRWLEVTPTQFYDMANRFRNPEIWKLNDGCWEMNCQLKGIGEVA